MALQTSSWMLCALLLPALSVKGQILRLGSCEKQNVTVKQNFIIDQYLGRWYEEERYFAVPELGLSCVTAEYSPHHDGGIKVNNTGIRNHGHATSTVGTGYAPDPKIPAKLLVKFPGAGPAGTMWIVGTDYETFSVVYSCANLGAFRLIDAWLLSRDRQGFSHDVMDKINRILSKHNVEKGPFHPVKQQGCTN